MKINTLLLLTFFLIFNGCKPNTENLTFVEKVERAHAAKDFLAKEAIQFDLNLEFGGVEKMNATFTLLTNSTKAVIAFKNGAKIIIDQDKVFYSATIPNEAGVRFDAYTWSYFFLFPYKLSDPGTIWNTYAYKEKDSAKYLTEKLTFTSGTGDAPDDWYVVYADATTNLVQKVAYIVTLKANKEEAEKNPHAIQYSAYTEIDGIPIATKWVFYGWQEGNGLTDELGHATLSNIKFIKADLNYFKPGTAFKKN